MGYIVEALHRAVVTLLREAAMEGGCGRRGAEYWGIGAPADKGRELKPIKVN